MRGCGGAHRNVENEHMAWNSNSAVGQEHALVTERSAAAQGLTPPAPRNIAGRIVQSIVSMLVVSIVVFALVRLSGDPIQIMAPAEATQKDIELMRQAMGMDRPWVVQSGGSSAMPSSGTTSCKSVRFRRPAMELDRRALRRHAGARRPRRRPGGHCRGAARGRVLGGAARQLARLRRARLRRAGPGGAAILARAGAGPRYWASCSTGSRRPGAARRSTSSCPVSRSARLRRWRA